MRISDWSSDVCSSDLGLASGVGELAEPWTTITRPAGVGLVLILTAKSALAPADRDAAVQVNVAERGLPLYCMLHCPPAGACTAAVAAIALPSLPSAGSAAAPLPRLARGTAHSRPNPRPRHLADPSIQHATS